MKKLTKATYVVLAVALLISAMVCNTAVQSASAQSPEYRIGIVTLSYAQTEDEIRGAEELIKEFGDAKDGGIMKHIVLPDNFSQEQETVISNIAGLADDPLVKAIVVNPAIGGTSAAFMKIKETRSDILLVAGAPLDDPNLIASAADIVVDANNVTRGYYEVMRAKLLGAKTFVHMSFPRHMSNEMLARRKDMIEQVCKDNGIEFVFVTTPDPTGEIGIAGSQQAVFEMMPELVDKYGKDTVFFTTNAAQNEPIIKRVIEFGALFTATGDVSPLVGYPSALGLNLKNEAGNWKAIVSKIEQAVVDKGQSGRMGLFAYSLIHCHSVGLVHLAKNILDKKDTGNRMNDIVAAYSSITPGCEWQAAQYKDASTNAVRENYFLMAEDVYIMGKGYSGVLSEPVPEKYLKSN